MGGRVLFSLIASSIISTGGCVTTPNVETAYSNETVSLEELEGLWRGYGDSQLVTSNSRCNVKMPLRFVVSNGRAISVCNKAWCKFDVPITDNGAIRFRYRNALRSTSDYGAVLMKDIVFVGRLFRDEGEGTFAGGGGCPGK